MTRFTLGTEGRLLLESKTEKNSEQNVNMFMSRLTPLVNQKSQFEKFSRD